MIKFVGKRSLLLQNSASKSVVDSSKLVSNNKTGATMSKFGPMYGRPPILLDEIGCVESGGATKIW